MSIDLFPSNDHDNYSIVIKGDDVSDTDEMDTTDFDLHVSRVQKNQKYKPNRRYRTNLAGWNKFRQEMRRQYDKLEVKPKLKQKLDEYYKQVWNKLTKTQKQKGEFVEHIMRNLQGELLSNTMDMFTQMNIGSKPDAFDGKDLSKELCYTSANEQQMADVLDMFNQMKIGESEQLTIVSSNPEHNNTDCSLDEKQSVVDNIVSDNDKCKHEKCDDINNESATRQKKRHISDSRQTRKSKRLCKEESDTYITIVSEVTVCGKMIGNIFRCKPNSNIIEKQYIKLP